MSQARMQSHTKPLLICLGVAFICALQSASAAGAQDSTRVPTVTLLKRIAEAVDSRRTGRAVFVVTNVDSMTVTAVLPERADAEALLRRLGRRYDIHGPFRTEIDLGPLDDEVPPDCIHDGQSNMFKAICPPERLSNLANISLIFRRRDGTSTTVTLPPRANAIFLNLSAFDKFVFPYYERVMGLGPTSAWRERILEDLRRR